MSEEINVKLQAKLDLVIAENEELKTRLKQYSTDFENVNKEKQKKEQEILKFQEQEAQTNSTLESLQNQINSMHQKRGYEIFKSKLKDMGLGDKQLESFIFLSKLDQKKFIEDKGEIYIDEDDSKKSFKDLFEEYKPHLTNFGLEKEIKFENTQKHWSFVEEQSMSTLDDIDPSKLTPQELDREILRALGEKV